VGLGKTNVRELTKLCYVVRFGFYALEQMIKMSMNGFRRRVATHYKTQTGTQMDKSLVVLDPGHWVSAIGPICCHSIARTIVCWRISDTRVLLCTYYICFSI
jgi:hypothetical protein